MKIKEIIQTRAREAAEQYRENLYSEHKARYEEKISEYEKHITEYYKSEIKLEFLEAVEEQSPDEERSRKIAELKKEHILLLKRVKDIENAGILEEYDIIKRAIEGVKE